MATKRKEQIRRQGRGSRRTAVTAEKQSQEPGVSRRQAFGRFAQYTAPLVVAVLMSEEAMAGSGSRGCWPPGSA